VHKYVKPIPIPRQNQKLTQQHNCKKSSSSPCAASVTVAVSAIFEFSRNGFELGKNKFEKEREKITFSL
jgi:hypothetical protein